MKESAIKGLKVLDLNDSVADAPNPGYTFTTISVEGYDTSLPEYFVKLALEKHFSSCGKVLFCAVGRDFARGILKSVAYVRFAGGAPEEKALKLNGTYLGRSTAIVKPATFPKQTLLDVNPFPGHDLSNPSTWIKRYMVRVTGYETSLPEIDLKMALCEHFSSCGDVWTIDVLSDCAYIHLRGEGSLEKALELNGSNMGNMTLVVEPLLSRPRDPRTYSVGEPQSILLEMEMEKKKKKEMKLKMKMEKEKEKALS